MSLREGDEDEQWTNRVSATVAALPTDIDGPLARLQAAHDALLDRAEACLAPLGWQKQATTKNAYRGGETHAQIIAKPGETIDVRFLSEGTGRQSVLTWSFEVQVRTSAPKP